MSNTTENADNRWKQVLLLRHAKSVVLPAPSKFLMIAGSPNRIAGSPNRTARSRSTADITREMAPEQPVTAYQVAGTNILLSTRITLFNCLYSFLPQSTSSSLAQMWEALGASSQASDPSSDELPTLDSLQQLTYQLQVTGVSSHHAVRESETKDSGGAVAHPNCDRAGAPPV